MYKIIFKANSVVEGLSTSEGVSVDVRTRLVAEAKFIRAFSYFYLVNLWGDVPLLLTTDYQANNTAARTPVADVYSQIISDLETAVQQLPDDYSASGGARVRANKWAAAALLSRVYLYLERWADAEDMASQIISNNSLFSLVSDLNLVYRGTSPEAILQLWSQIYPLDRNSFAVYSFGPLYGAMRTEYVESYESGDQRWAVWGRSVDSNGVTYPCYFKYYDFSTPPLDYSTVFRLAEQYLIRAEARIRSNDLVGAAADINVIRIRAGLPEIVVTTADEMFAVVVGERKSEFATEWGHRWFDLKRWDLADALLGPVKAGWSSSDVLYPIPEQQIINNPSTVQNPG